MAARSHDLLDITACPILVPALQAKAFAMARPIAATVGDCDVAFTATDTGIDVAIRTERKFKAERLTILTQRMQPARLSLNGEVVLTARAPAVRMGKALVELPICELPAGDRHGRSDAGATGARRAGRRQIGRRPVLRPRPVHPAHRRDRESVRRRRRQIRHRGAAARRAQHPRAEAGDRA